MAKELEGKCNLWEVTFQINNSEAIIEAKMLDYTNLRQRMIEESIELWKITREFPELQVKSTETAPLSLLEYSNEEDVQSLSWNTEDLNEEELELFQNNKKYLVVVHKGFRGHYLTGIYAWLSDDQMITDEATLSEDCLVNDKLNLKNSHIFNLEMQDLCVDPEHLDKRYSLD